MEVFIAFISKKDGAFKKGISQRCCAGGGRLQQRAAERRRDDENQQKRARPRPARTPQKNQNGVGAFASL